VTLQELLAEAARRGIDLYPDGNSIHYRGPRDAVADLKPKLAAKRGELLNLLHAQLNSAEALTLVNRLKTYALPAGRMPAARELAQLCAARLARPENGVPLDQAGSGVVLGRPARNRARADRIGRCTRPSAGRRRRNDRAVVPWCASDRGHEAEMRTAGCVTKASTNTFSSRSPKHARPSAWRHDYRLRPRSTSRNLKDEKLNPPRRAKATTPPYFDLTGIGNRPILPRLAPYQSDILTRIAITSFADQWIGPR
jgi:hypothetical protein